MAKQSQIEWTDATWNPWYGCSKISAGCANCYMYRDMDRFGMDPWTVQRSKSKFDEPLRWTEPRLVFTCSWSDFFHPDADDWRDEAWEIIRTTPHLTYQILTKRPHMIADRLPEDWGQGYDNVWLGVSAEDQDYADLRIPPLLKIPAQIRFVSAEPLLGPINFNHLQPSDPPVEIDSLNGTHGLYRPHRGVSESIDWVIAGGESGYHARKTKPDWVRQIKDQCHWAGIPFFFKQWGEWKPVVTDGEVTYQRVGKKKAGRLLDGSQWNQMPEYRSVEYNGRK